MIENIFNQDDNEIIANSQEENYSELQTKRSEYLKELKRVKRKLRKLKDKYENTYYLSKSQRKKYKKKIKHKKKEKRELESRIFEIEKRLADCEYTLSVLISEVMKINQYLRNEVIQKIVLSNNPKEIEGYIKVIEGGDDIGKKI